MQKKTKSILDELDNLLTSRDREAFIESRAGHVIQGAINLLNFIRENYDRDTAGELERRLLNSIRAQDPSKFVRGVRKLKGDQ